MKICVYAISKNEEKFVRRFYESAKDADCILIADTGSTDKTVSIARECGITVYNIAVRPWRFDTARNIALGLVPADIDICVSLDLDEILLKGWREEIERVWVVGKTNTLQHLFRNTSPLDSSTGVTTYHSTRISSRFGWIWKGICHEMSYPDLRMKREWAYSDKVMIEHLPDETKSRDSYEDLVKAGVAENPTDLYAQYYYVRHLYNDKRYEECIVEADKLINLCPSDISKYLHEFSRFQLNYIYLIKGSCFIDLGKYSEAVETYKIACNMELGIRQPFMILSTLYFNHKEYALCYEYCMKALEIREMAIYKYETREIWNASWDWAAISAANLGLMHKAIEYGIKALELSPNDKRLKNNLNLYRKSLV